MTDIRKLLNTLYVTAPESYLAKDGENVVVLVGEEALGRIPIHNLESIVHFGYTGASPALMGLCAERGVALNFCTEHGRFLARVSGRVSGNVLLRRRQYRMADDEAACLQIALALVLGKVLNQRTVLQRAMRDHAKKMLNTAVPMAIKQLGRIGIDVSKATSLSVLRGLEGEAAQVYFGVVDNLILENKDTFYMTTRNRRPPQDPFNAVLSFLYTLLANDVAAALETVGLDPAVGFLHRDRPGRSSLALDVMEELRAYLADRLALSLVNRKQLGKRDFTYRESGAVYLDDSGRKKVIEAWQARKRETIQHPFLQERIEIGLLPFVQSLLLARYIRGDLDAYPPFVFK